MGLGQILLEMEARLEVVYQAELHTMLSLQVVAQEVDLVVMQALVLVVVLVVMAYLV